MLSFNPSKERCASLQAVLSNYSCCQSPRPPHPRSCPGVDGFPKSKHTAAQQSANWRKADGEARANNNPQGSLHSIIWDNDFPGGATVIDGS